MTVHQTQIEHCFVISPTIFEDERGYFFESYNAQKFQEITGLSTNFIQDNQSFSSRGVLRGLHYQKGEYAQAKLVRVSSGKVLDVAVDMRENSLTYLQHVSVELSEENQKQLFVPRGFAHGFVVLSDEATFCYKCDNYYHQPSESGIIYNDPTIGVDWQMPESELLVSPKDLELPFVNP